MKKEKKLKLDQLSSSELKQREIAQIKGGITTCPCRCSCRTTEVMYFAQKFNYIDKVHMAPY